MKRYYYIFFIIYLFLLSPTYSQTNYLDFVSHYLQDFPDKTEFSVAIWENGKTAQIGLRKENGQIIQVDNFDRLFEIGSITKTFTANLVMQQMETGNIDLQTPIQQYLPVKIAKDTFKGHTITLEHLLTHTSGLSNGPDSYTLPYIKALICSPKNPNKYFKAKHYHRYLQKFELDYIPGTEWNYNNSAYALLGSIVERQSGMSWAEMTEKYIFTPLEMNDSDVSITKENKKKLVPGITSKGKKSKPWDMNFINPAGSIKSTLNDMLKYALAEIEISPSYFQEAQNPVDYRVKMPEGKLWNGNANGLGWWHNLEDKNHPFMWHAGSTGGYTSFVGFSHQANRAVVVLSNISSSHPKSREKGEIPKPIKLGHELMRWEM